MILYAYLIVFYISFLFSSLKCQHLVLIKGPPPPHKMESHVCWALTFIPGTITMWTDRLWEHSSFIKVCRPLFFLAVPSYAFIPRKINNWYCFNYRSFSADTFPPPALATKLFFVFVFFNNLKWLDLQFQELLFILCFGYCQTNFSPSF